MFMAFLTNKKSLVLLKYINKVTKLTKIQLMIAVMMKMIQYQTANCSLMLAVRTKK